MKFALRFLPVLGLGLFLSTPGFAEVPNDPRHPSRRKDKPSAKEVEHEREWISVDKTSSAALEGYLDKKLRGSRHMEAAVLLPVAKKLEAIVAGEVKPGVVIPFEVYGEDTGLRANKLAVAVSCDAKRRIGRDVGACWEYRSPEFEDRSSFSQGEFAHPTYAAFPRGSMAGPGSILAFDSGGDQCPSDTLPVMVSAKGKGVHFGVMEGVGFVHLGGEGQVVYPDGRVVSFR